MKILLGIAALSFCMLMLFGWVMNVVKIFNESESNKVKTFRIVFAFFSILGSIMGFLTFPKHGDTESLKASEKKVSKKNKSKKNIYRKK